MPWLNPIETVTYHDATPATSIAPNLVRDNIAGSDEAAAKIRNASPTPRRKRPMSQTPDVIYPALSLHISARVALKIKRAFNDCGKVKDNFQGLLPRIDGKAGTILRQRC